MNRRDATRAGLGIFTAVAIAACSGGPASSAAAPSAAAVEPSIASLAPSAAPASPSVAPSIEPSDSPAPVRSHKPLPSIDPAELDAYLSSSITLLDLSDGAITVDVTYVDPSSGKAIDFGTYDLAATEQMTDQVPPGTYKVVFHLPDAAKVPACTIDVGDKDAFTFATIPGGVAVARHGVKPGSGKELSVATSSLCGH